jgi:hypothetical protein
LGLGGLLVEVPWDGGSGCLVIPAGITAFLRSHDPRCESRPRCHRLPKSAYEASLEELSHPLYPPRPVLVLESESQCAAGAAMAAVASKAV